MSLHDRVYHLRVVASLTLVAASTTLVTAQAVINDRCADTIVTKGEEPISLVERCLNEIHLRLAEVCLVLERSKGILDNAHESLDLVDKISGLHDVY